MDIETPNIRLLRAGPGRQLLVTWKNGAESTIDVAGFLAAYVVLTPLLADDTTFRAVTVGEWGWSARWSDELEISSDTLWRLALEQGSTWLKAWRRGHRMTQVEAASALGVSPRMWRYYEAGTHLLSKTVRLACAGLDAQAKAA